MEHGRQRHEAGARAKRSQRADGRPRRPYRKPRIESSDVFEQFTLQSCNLFPGECSGGLQ